MLLVIPVAVYICRVGVALCSVPAGKFAPVALLYQNCADFFMPIKKFGLTLYFKLLAKKNARGLSLRVRG